MEKKITWRRLDNSAKIFPLASSKKFSTVFRLSCVMKEKVNLEALEIALEITLNKFYYFKVKMKQGLFWYYFESNNKKPIIELENDYPCRYIDPKTNNDYLFKVTYFQNKINIDIFHSLTDGNSGIDFFKELIYNYIEVCYSDNFKQKYRTDRKFIYNTEDSYVKNYNKKLKGNSSSKKAFSLKGTLLPFGAISVTHEYIELDKLKEVSKEKNVTITQFLTSVLIYSIYKTNYKKYNGKKPIKVCIPVDLRKYFQSITISNFFSYITVEMDMKQDKYNNFDNILAYVKDYFEKKLVKEELEKTMAANVKLGNNLIIKLIPLVLKKIIVKLSYMEIRKYTTTTFSNIGRIGIIAEYKKYIDSFIMMIAPETVEKIKCSACSFENYLVFSFTSILEDKKIEKFFYDFLKENGIEVKIESNGVCDVIS